jgi:RNA polymerase sigma-70 factor, ECF subfamily
MSGGMAGATHGGERSDEELLLAFIRGESGCFDQLFLRYRQPVFSFFRRRLADPALAEELAQETFVAVFKSAPRFKPRSLVRTWIFAIAFKLLNAHRRKSAFRAMFLGVLPPDREPGTSPGFENQLQVRQAIARLDATDREILLLREFEQLSYSEIASVLALPLNTVRSRLFRARRAFQQLLADPGAVRSDAAPSEVRL